MPRCADVFYRRVEITFFMSQYFYSFSLQKKICDLMPDVLCDRDILCDLHAIMQSRVKHLMTRKLSHDATSTQRRIHHQDLSAGRLSCCTPCLRFPILIVVPSPSPLHVYHCCLFQMSPSGLLATVNTLHLTLTPCHREPRKSSRPGHTQVLGRPPH